MRNSNFRPMQPGGELGHHKHKRWLILTQFWSNMRLLESNFLSTIHCVVKKKNYVIGWIHLTKGNHKFNLEIHSFPSRHQKIHVFSLFLPLTPIRFQVTTLTFLLWFGSIWYNFKEIHLLVVNALTSENVWFFSPLSL